MYAASMTKFEARLRCYCGIGRYKARHHNLGAGFQKVQADDRQDHFQIGQECLHICPIGFWETPTLCQRLLTVVENDASGRARHLDEASLEITHMALGQRLIARCDNDRRFPEAPITGTTIAALAHAVGLADVGPHAERVLRIGPVKNVDAGAVDLRSCKQSSKSGLRCDEHPAGPTMDRRDDESARHAIDQEELDGTAENGWGVGHVLTSAIASLLMASSSLTASISARAALRWPMIAAAMSSGSVRCSSAFASSSRSQAISRLSLRLEMSSRVKRRKRPSVPSSTRSESPLGSVP